MPSITLTYFDAAGRAEPARLAFFIGGVEFEDKRVGFPEFMEMKPTLPYGQLPVLEVDGVTYAQSSAIVRYAGKISGLYPEDNLAALKVDEIVSSVDDFNNLLGPSMREKDPEKKKAMREAMLDGPLVVVMGNMEKQLKANPGDWFVGDSITIADLVANIPAKILLAGQVDHIPPSTLDAFPALKAHAEVVSKHPKVVEYYASKK
ncbi:unnamed protein product [Discosporangium mesarthrocarpum]